MEKKIKILHVIGRHPKGGVGSFLKNINANIDHNKIHFDYLVNDSDIKSNFASDIKDFNSNYTVLPKLSFRNFLNYLRELDVFYNKHNDYTAIHVHSVNLALFNYYFARKYGIKNLIAHSHSTKSSDVFLRRIRNFFLIFPVKKFATHILACNYDSARFLFGSKRANSRELMLVKNAINTQLFSYNQEIRNKTRLQHGWENKFVIGHVGHFIPVKNHNYLLNIFAEILHRDSSAILVLIGDGELKSSIKEKANALNIQESVVFLGLRNDVHRYMQAFDTFILPSKFEGLPLVGVEAQTSGLPCYLSSNISREIAITDSVKFLDVNLEPSKWADLIVKSKGDFIRYNRTSEIIAAGYDIKQEAKNLERYYFSISLNDNE